MKAYANVLLTLGLIGAGVGIYLYATSSKGSGPMFSSRWTSMDPSKIKKTIDDSTITITETMIRPVKKAARTMGKHLENFAEA